MKHRPLDSKSSALKCVCDCELLNEYLINYIHHNKDSILVSESREENINDWVLCPVSVIEDTTLK